ncbi:hypothetical protein BCR39DRAFT_186998 [Naematelia encephala]|uniref:Complex 1 protein-domain-containing protein n=1 Tax=Naematelia encephala TaxID=71784 RepID=A0A1Y2B241_9TREE|nr:hypothetical protein BCR39DRAFT_186998 [Naematelia encephala]
MVRSGLQSDVIKMYRQGVRNAYSKPQEVRGSFLLHLRYNFRNPPLGPRDYTAIEHQLRRMSRTLEMLSDPSVRNLTISDEMRDWWAASLQESHSSIPSQSSTPSQQSSATSPSTTTSSPTGGDVVLKGESEKSGMQWGGALPGHGGT